MTPDNKKIDDFTVDLFDIDVDLDNPLADEIRAPEDAPKSEEKEIFPDLSPDDTQAAGPKKRTSKDFNPDMDALLLTAQSPMILEGMQQYTQGNFSSTNLSIYLEALNGISLYIKILGRNPNNYNKLKALIDSDTDCKEVENVAFGLYQKKNGASPNADQEKITAFEIFESLFKEAVNKSSISNSMKTLKKYLLLSGSIDEVRVKDLLMKGSKEFIADVNNIIQHVNLALEMQKKGKYEIAKGLKGRDLNIFVIKATYLLYLYSNLSGNDKMADYYARVHNNFKKYFIIRE